MGRVVVYMLLGEGVGLRRRNTKRQKAGKEALSTPHAGTAETASSLKERSDLTVLGRDK